MPSKSAKSETRSPWSLVPSAAMRVGDALLTLDDVVALTPGYSRELLFKALESGAMAGRWIGGPHGWVTTWSALLEWARDSEDTAKRRQGHLPVGISGPRQAAIKRHALAKARGGGVGFQPLRTIGPGED